MNLRLCTDWLLVRADPIAAREGSIILPHGRRVCTATVLAVGPGRVTQSGARIAVDVQVGNQVAFFRENLEHRQGKELMHALHELGDSLALIRAPDVLFVLDCAERVEVS